jgi:type I restriction-modification system DNA methylase subunit
MIPSQSFDEAFDRVKDLVHTFKENEREFLSPSYSEIDVRKDFIDKFWIALGWDVNHDLQKNPYRRQVKVENSVNVEGRMKKADYAFLAPNFRDVLFFVEAKKPARNIDNPDDYFQTVRYGWNAGTPVSILTDFEQFRLLDCRYKPDVHVALHRAVKKFHFTEYADEEKFSEIYYLFSSGAAAGGALDKFAAALPKAPGRAMQRKLFAGAYKSVDEDFLQELDGLREELARSFKNRNSHLNGEELTEATQRTLDRLVFMRFLEDKLIESEAIVERLGERGTAWGDFVSESARLDRIYNGIIFKRHAIIDDTKFAVDDRVFAGMRERLAHTNTSYNFNYIPIHVLGSIYERFLGKIIVATDKRAKVVEKPEVRKAGGVYYTPEYIVRHIVQQTVGEMIRGKTPEEISAMRFADVACGSGSFLLGVYDELLRHHASYYNEPQNRKKALKAGCVENADGSLRLSLTQKKDVLLNNIYGVDLDAQAVEVAQLSLFLKLLEEETTASAKSFQLHFRETMLPSLGKNVIHGNSLIGWDILEGKLFGDDEERKLNPLDFSQAFPEVMRQGGFSAVVGNPPYVRIQGFPRKQIEYFSRHYQSAKGNYDLYVNFVERAFDLVRPGGKVGLIVPNKFFKTDYGVGLRKFIAEKNALERVVDFGAKQVFQATTYTCLLFLGKGENKTCQYASAEPKAESLTSPLYVTLDSNLLKESAWLFAGEADQRLMSKLSERSVRLLDLPADMSRGSSTGDDETFVVEAGSLELEEQILRTPVFASDFNRYVFRPSGRWRIIFPYEVVNGTSRLYAEQEMGLKFPRAYAYLKSRRAALERRKQFAQWYGYSAPRNLHLHSKAQLAVPLLADRGLFTYIPPEERQRICPMASGGFTITVAESCRMDPLYVLGLLNSRLLFWKLARESNVFRGGWITCTKQYFGELPIRAINFSDTADRERHDHVVDLVRQMLKAKEQLSHARTDHDRNFYESKCTALDRQIDVSVYELYALSAAEIAIVRGSS